MNIGFLHRLEECIFLVDQLLRRLERDRAELREALEGPLLADYLQGTEKAASLLCETKKQLIRLYHEQEQL